MNKPSFVVRPGQEGCGALCGKDYQTREGGKVRMNGNVRMWHVKGGPGGVKEMRSEALQETDLVILVTIFTVLCHLGQ